MLSSVGASTCPDVVRPVSRTATPPWPEWRASDGLDFRIQAPAMNTIMVAMIGLSSVITPSPVMEVFA